MIVNPLIKRLYKEISNQSVKYANSPDKDRKYMKRLLNVFKNDLSEEEQLFVIKSLLETVSYKNIVTDPDNVMQLHNIKLRHFTYIFFLISILFILASILFKTNDSVGYVITVLGNIFKILSI